ncbi:STAS domain-containing protein [Actinoplanes sp. CA-051413]|uniref:STAS domain-containing protein n=1 Tax=Actinoplanes sp. CA-051413 TaxID=3239899 RepID=UPI003D969567
MIVSATGTSNGVVRLSVAGEVDMATVGDLEKAMIDAITADGTAQVTVDIAEVTFCDSSGLAAFDRSYFLAGRQGVSFRLTSPQPGVRQVLQITGLLETLTQP